MGENDGVNLLEKNSKYFQEYMTRHHPQEELGCYTWEKCKEIKLAHYHFSLKKKNIIVQALK